MTNHPKRRKNIHVGVDVGKYFLDIAIHEKGLHWQVPNNPDGIKSLLRRLAHYSVKCLAMEATGRYEFELAQAAHQKGLPVAIIKPLRIRRFAGAINQLAKTDKIDAAVIAQFAAMTEPAATPKKSENLIAIRNLTARRRQLIGMRTQEINRQKIMGEALADSCQRILDGLNAEIELIEAQLAKQVEAQAQWQEKQQLLKTAPGVGNTLIYTLLADLPELGSLNNKEVGALVGVAPINRDSGRQRGKRRIQGGRANIRTVLYMATLSATQCNPVIREFYQRLLKQGKHKKVAITACMRKFITMLNAMVRDKSVWAY